MSIAVPTPAEQTSGQFSERQGNVIKTTVIDATTARAAVAGDIDAFVVFSAAGAATYTLPDSTVTAGKVFPIGSEITVFAKGVGGVTIAKTGADTLTGTATAAQNIARRVRKVAATEWATYV